MAQGDGAFGIIEIGLVYLQGALGAGKGQREGFLRSSL
jgi:hypothetical protein